MKHEDVYLKAYNSIGEVGKGLAAWFDRHNEERRHQGLDDRTPDEVYWGTLPGVKNGNVNRGGAPLKTCFNSV